MKHAFLAPASWKSRKPIVKANYLVWVQKLTTFLALVCLSFRRQASTRLVIVKQVIIRPHVHQQLVATASLLKFNRPEQIEIREILIDPGLYPPRTE